MLLCGGLKLTAGCKLYCGDIWCILHLKKCDGKYELKCVLLVRGCFVDISVYPLLGVIITLAKDASHNRILKFRISVTQITYPM